jgi:hypothetical protein
VNAYAKQQKLMKNLGIAKVEKTEDREKGGAQ